MRDPKRIARIVEKLRTYWLAHPDLRLGQILHNSAPASVATFYVEDDLIEEGLAALIEGRVPHGR